MILKDDRETSQKSKPEEIPGPARKVSPQLSYARTATPPALDEAQQIEQAISNSKKSYSSEKKQDPTNSNPWPHPNHFPELAHADGEAASREPPQHPRTPTRELATTQRDVELRFPEVPPTHTEPQTTPKAGGKRTAAPSPAHKRSTSRQLVLSPAGSPQKPSAKKVKAAGKKHRKKTTRTHKKSRTTSIIRGGVE